MVSTQSTRCNGGIEGSLSLTSKVFGPELMLLPSMVAMGLRFGSTGPKAKVAFAPATVIWMLSPSLKAVARPQLSGATAEVLLSL